MTQIEQAAVIGLGFIGKAHVEALRRIGIPITGILGANHQTAQKEAEKLGLKAYQNLNELLEDNAVTSVHQCGPNDIHSSYNLACINARKHVFSEKPLGISVTECQEQLRAVKKIKLRHAVNFTYRGYTAVQTMRELVQAGEIGEIKYIRGHYLQDWLLFDSDYNWRVEGSKTETRAVADIGSHLADMTRFVTGLEPVKLLSRFNTLHPIRQKPVGSVETFSQSRTETIPVEVHSEDQASILAEYIGGVKANFEISQVAAGHKNDFEIEIIGTTGTVRWQQESPEQLWLGSRGADQIIRLKNQNHSFAHYPSGHPEGYPDAITNIVRQFYSQGGQYPTFEDGLAAARFIEAAYQSHIHQSWAEVAD